MIVYCVYVGDHYMKTFSEKFQAELLAGSLRDFFALEHLDYSVRVLKETV